MKKAYDRIDWQFLDKMSESRGFGVIFRNQVKSIPLCFTINDTNSSYFMAVKGLKQGDLLSHICLILLLMFSQKNIYKAPSSQMIPTPPPSHLLGGGGRNPSRHTTVAGSHLRVWLAGASSSSCGAISGRSFAVALDDAAHPAMMDAGR
jgi:hypothetical protein